jgi:hypothetical protein
MKTNKHALSPKNRRIAGIRLAPKDPRLEDHDQLNQHDLPAKNIAKGSDNAQNFDGVMTKTV